MKSLTKSFLATAVLALASQLNALTLDISDTRLIGRIDPGSPASSSDEVSYINQLLSMAADAPAVLGDIDATVDSRNYDRTGVSVVGLPAATTTGANGNQNPSNSVNVTGFTYLLAKYGNESYVWYVGGLSGVQAVPLNEPSALGGQGQSHFSLFNPAPTVPEGGATVALLGLALGALALAKRKFRR